MLGIFTVKNDYSGAWLRSKLKHEGIYNVIIFKIFRVYVDSG